MKKAILLMIIMFSLILGNLVVYANDHDEELVDWDDELFYEEVYTEDFYSEDIEMYLESQQSFETISPKAKVLDVLDRKVEVDPFSGVEMEYSTVEVEILEGEYKDQVLVAQSYMHPGGGKGYGNFQLKQNDTIFVQLQIIDDEIVHVDVMDYTRSRPTYLLMVIFIGLLIVFGRKQGVKSVVTLGFTLFLVLKFMLPLLFNGYSPVLLALATGAVVTATTFLMVSGFSRKTIAAIAGTIGGLASAALIAFIFANAMKLTGFHGEEERMLQLFHPDRNFNFQGILLAGIIIGALGAVMDVAISIASSMDEVYKSNPLIKIKQLFQSGMNVGRDIMGTMANTLILAYVGAALPLLMMIYAYESEFNQLINMEFLVVEILRTIAGSIGLILAIPITAFVTSILIKKNKS